MLVGDMMPPLRPQLLYSAHCIVQWRLAARRPGIHVCVHTDQALHHQIIAGADGRVQRRPALQQACTGSWRH